MELVIISLLRFIGLMLWCVLLRIVCLKQKTAYEMRISDWSSDVCSSDFDQTKRIGFDTIDIFADPLDIDQNERDVIKNAARRNGLPIKRLEERRDGKDWVSMCNCRWAP